MTAGSISGPAFPAQQGPAPRRIWRRERMRQGKGMARHAAIVGAGVIGCSIAPELRRRGFDVTVVDRNGEAGHGTTSASCGVVRRYYSQPGMIAMAHEALSI